MAANISTDWFSCKGRSGLGRERRGAEERRGAKEAWRAGRTLDGTSTGDGMGERGRASLTTDFVSRVGRSFNLPVPGGRIWHPSVDQPRMSPPACRTSCHPAGQRASPLPVERRPRARDPLSSAPTIESQQVRRSTSGQNDATSLQLKHSPNITRSQ